MTSTQLAKKLGISTPSLNRLKEREKIGGITLKQLKKIASALECEMIYAFIPKKPLEKIIHEQAQEKANALLKKAAIQMELENQGLSKLQQKKQLQQLIEELMYTKNIWED
jgi:predicted DNA-binding mobile mystery protein A